MAVNATRSGGMKRRDFFGVAGAGLFVFFGADLHAQEPARLPGRQSGPTDFNAYLKIGADGRVTCLAGKVELGQGVMTELGMVLAEELDVALDTVDVVLGDTDLCPYDMGTFGSMTTPLLAPAVRRAGAEAKAVLLEMAAERLKVAPDRLRAKGGTIAEAGNAANAVTYGQLVDGKRIERHLANVPVKTAPFQVIGGAPFIGSVGLNVPQFEAHFTPAVEVGWRLLPEQWGNGYATEAARAAVEFGFTRLGLDEIVSFTTTANEPSRAVMERLGMTHDEADDFDHPSLPDWPQRRHVLYRLKRPR